MDRDIKTPLLIIGIAALVSMVFNYDVIALVASVCCIHSSRSTCHLSSFKSPVSSLQSPVSTFTSFLFSFFFSVLVLIPHISEAADWTPADRTTALWLDATTGVNHSSGEVDSWDDQSGNNRDVSSSGATRPDNGGSIDSKTALNFDGSDDRLIGSGQASWINGTEYTTFAVVKADLTTGGDYYLGTNQSGITDKGLHIGWRNNTSWTLAHYGDDQDWGSQTRNTNSNLYTVQYTDPDGDFWINGNSQGDGNNSNPTADLNTDNEFLVGQGANGNHWDGLIAEVVIVTGAITTAEREQIEGYLAWKWGLETSLPDDHGYRYGKPVKNLNGIFADDFETDRGWTGYAGGGEWERGAPTQVSAYDGSNVIANDLDGNHENNVTIDYLTSPVIDCTDNTGVYLNFRRNAHFESNTDYDSFTVEVYDGSAWQEVWTSDDTPTDIVDSEWMFKNFDISTHADGISNVQVRFSIRSDGGVVYRGWFIDDLLVEGDGPGNYAWDGGGGDNDWTTGANWIGDVAPSAGDKLTFAGTTRLTPNNDFAAATSFDNITFNSGAGGFNLNGNQITLTGDITNNDNTEQDINFDIILSGTRTIYSTSARIEFDGVLSGSGGITAAGGNWIFFNATNTYTGTTTINSGAEILLVTANGAISNSSNIVNNGSLYFDNTENYTYSGTISGSGDIRRQCCGTGQDTITLSGNNSFTGRVDPGMGFWRFNSIANLSSNSALGAPTTAGNGTIGLGFGATMASLVYNGSGHSTNRNIDIDNSTGAGLWHEGSGTLTWSGTTNTDETGAVTFTLGGSTAFEGGYSGLIENGASSGLAVTKDGTGTWTLSNSNTYTGGTSLTNGQLNINNATALGGGAGTFTIEGGTTIDNTSGSSKTLTNNHPITVNGNFTFTGSDALNLGTGAVAMGGTLRTITVSASTLTMDGTISGTGGLTKNGAGTFSIDGSGATWTGTTTINAGVLLLGDPGADNYKSTDWVIANTATVRHTAGDKIVNDAVFTVNTGGTYDLDGNSEAIGQLKGGGNVTDINRLEFKLPNASEDFSGVISGTGYIELMESAIAPANVQVLSGNNTFTGRTRIENGILSINTINNIDGTPSSLGSPTTAPNGEIALGKNDKTGTLLYTGGTQSTNRIVDLEGTTGGGVIESSGGGTLTFTTDFTVNGVGVKTLTLQGTGTGVISGIIPDGSGTVALTKDGTGTWTLTGANTYTGKTTIDQGTLSFDAINNIADGSSALGDPANAANGTIDLAAANSATLVYTGGTQSTDRVINLAGGAGDDATIQNNGSGVLTFTSAMTVANGNKTLTFNANSDGITMAHEIPDPATGSLSVVKTGSGTLRFDFNYFNTYSGGFTLSAGTVDMHDYQGPGTGTFTIEGGTTINNTRGSAVFLDQNNAMTWNGNFTITGTDIIDMGTGAVTLTGNRQVTISGAAITIGGVIDDGGSTYNLTKAGTGNLILTGNSTYDGATTISAGTLEIGTVPGLNYGTVSGDIDVTTANPNTSITTDLAETEDAIAGNTTEIYTGMFYDADGSVSFTEDNDDKARIWIDGVLVLSNDACCTRTSTADLGLAAGWHTIEIRISNGGGGSGPVTSPGIGYDPAGGTAWQHLEDPGDGSILKTYSTAGAITSSSGITNNGALEFHRTDAITYSTAITGTGTVTKYGPSDLILTGANTFTGDLTIISGDLKVGNNGTTGSVDADIVNNGTLLFLRTDAYTYSGDISGSGNIWRNCCASGGGLTLTGNSSYTGWTYFDDGYLTINSIANVGGGSSALGAPPSAAAGEIYLGWTSNDAGLIYTGSGHATNRDINMRTTTGDVSIEQSGSSGTLTWSGDISTTYTGSKTFTLEGSTAASGVFSGALDDGSGTVSLVKDGTGTWTVSGTNTYTGNTTIAGGTLNITGSTHASSNLTVQSGGTLAGDGTVNGSVTVNGGGILAPGDAGEGTLNVGATILQSAATLNMGLGTSSDQVVVTGNLTLDGTLNVTDAGGFAVGTYTIMTYSGVLTDSKMKIGTLPGGLEGFISASGGNVDLIVEDYGTWDDSRNLRLNTSPSGADIPGTVTDFPVLIRLNAGNFPFDDNGGDGSTLRFASEAGAPLPYEIEEWTDGTSAAIWVLVPSILGNNFSQYITMYWHGSAKTSASDGGAVFETSNGFSSIYHMNNEPNGNTANSLLDATSNSHDATPQGFSAVSLTTGNIGQAVQFDGTDDAFTDAAAGADMAGRSTYGISIWSSVASAYDILRSSITLCQSSDCYNTTFNLAEYHDIGDTRLWVNGGTIINDPNSGLDATGMHHFYFVQRATNDNELYVDGQSIWTSTTDYSLSADLDIFRIGMYENDEWHKGIIDEVRLETATRSDDWAKLTYMNQRAVDKLVEIEQYSTWSKSKSIVVNTGTRGANTSNPVYKMPLLIRLIDDVSLDFAGANSGNSLRFANGNGSHLSYEIVDWGASAAEVWVNVDTILSANSSQAITMYWGKTGAPSRSDGAGVFETDNNFAGVWHLSNNDFSDVTANRNDGINDNTGSTTGIIDEARSFDGSTQEIGVGSNPSLNITSQITLSTWINADLWSGGNRRILQKGNGDDQYAIYDQGDLLRFRATGLTDADLDVTLPSTGSWHHIMATYDGSDKYIYIDGVQAGTDAATGSISTTTDSINIGHKPESVTGSDHFDGTMDEVRVASIARSADWAKLEYENQKATSWVADAEDYTLWENNGVITINTSATGADVSGDVYDFPLLVRLDASKFNFDEAQTNGEDIRFANAAGVHLPYQIERWDAAADSAEIWVNVDYIAGNNAEQFIRYYWGNAGAPDRSDGNSAFDTDLDFAGVWHLAETTGGTEAIKNSASDNYHGTEAGNPAFEALGAVGNAMDFDGTGDWVDLGTGCMVVNNWTLSFWFNAQNPSDNDRLFIQGDAGCTSGNRQIMVFWDSTALHAKRETAGTAGPPDASTEVLSGNTWYHFSWTSDGTTDSLFINGEYTSGPLGTGNMGINGNNFIGNRNAGGNDWGGLIDEIQLSGVQRTSAWVKLAFENQKPNQTTSGIFSPSSFARSVRLTFKTTSLGLTGDVDDFPMLVRLSGDDIDFSLTKLDGSDILFVDSSGAFLYHEVVDWNRGGDTGSVWVKVPKVDQLDGDYITLYYGCAACPSPYDISDSVWNGYVGVWHLKGGETEALDVTGNGNTGTYESSQPMHTGVTTPFAPSFDGTTDFISMGALGFTRAAGEPLTISAWGLNTGNGSGVEVLAGTRQGSGAGDLYKMGRSAGNWNWQTDPTGSGGAASSSMTDDVWTHVAGTYDGANIILYKDGVPADTTASASAAIDQDNFAIGKRADVTGEFWDGRINEVRIATSAKSADYIKLSYATQHVDSVLITSDDITGPVPIPNLQFWVKADSGVEDLNDLQPGDGDAVKDWLDFSGNSNDATQGTPGNRPTWHENVVNGKPVLRFDKDNDLYLDAGDLGQVSFAAGITVFAVAKHGITNYTQYGGIVEKRGGSAPESFAMLRNSGNDGVRFESEGGDAANTANLTVGQFYLLTGLHKSGESNIIYLDGKNPVTTATTDVVVGDAASMYIGKRTISGDAFDGDIAEILIYNRSLTDLERTMVHDYLNRKYALTPPDNVTNLTATSISSGVRLTWTDPVSTFTSADSVAIYASTSAYPADTSGGIQVGKFDTETFTYDWPQEFAGTWYFSLLVQDKQDRWSAAAQAAQDTATIGGGDRKITYKFDASSYSVSGAEADFPMLIRLNGSDEGIFDACPSANGTHLRFYDHDGGTGEDTLAYEIEEWTSGTSAAIWVLVPSVANGRDSITMVYNGCTNSDASSEANVFSTSNNFQAVHHMEEASGNILDATTNNNDGVFSGTTTGYAVAGNIGDAYDFIGTDEFFTITDANSLDFGTGDYTISFWVNPDAFSGSQQIYFKHFNPGVESQFNGSGNILTYTENGSFTTNNTLATATWTYFTIRRTGGTVYHYINAVQEANTRGSSSNLDNANDLCIGDDCIAAERFNGQLDEFRWVNTARSTDWIKLSYENQRSTSNTWFNNTTREQRIYVDDANGDDGANDCGEAENPSTPKKTVESAIGCIIANHVDTMKVVVMPGTYTADEDWSGNNAQHTMIMGQDPANPPVFNSHWAADNATIYIDSKKHLRNLAITPNANNDNGIHFATGSSQNSIIGCRVYSDAFTTDLGIFTNDATQVLIANNIIDGVTEEGIRIKATGAINMNVMHNVFTGPANEGIWFELSGDVTDVGIINNIFYNFTDGIEEQDATDNDVGLISHNLFHNVTNQVVGGASSDNAVTGDPLFVSTDITSPAAYKLAPGSPAIDAGTVDLTGAWTATEDFDYLGTARPIDDSLDIGAFEGRGESGDAQTSEIDLLTVDPTSGGDTIAVYNDNFHIVFRKNEGGGIANLFEGTNPVSAAGNDLAGSNVSLFDVVVEGVVASNQTATAPEILAQNGVHVTIRQRATLGSFGLVNIYNIYASGHIYIQSEITNSSGTSSDKDITFNMSVDNGDEVSKFNNSENNRGYGYVTTAARDVYLGVTRALNTLGDLPDSDLDWVGSNPDDSTMEYTATNYDLGDGETAEFNFLLYIGEDDLTADLAQTIYNDSYNPSRLGMYTGTHFAEQSWQDRQLMQLSMDEGSGTTLQDLSYNGFTANLNGATYTSGQSGSGLDFTGVSDDYADGSTDALLDAGNHKTYMVWIRRDGWTGCDTDANFMGKGSSWFFSRSGNKVMFTMGGAVATTVNDAPDGEWFHVAATAWEDGVKLYMNGVLEDFAPGVTFSPDGAALRLGFKGGNTSFDGQLDDARIYNTFMHSEEIQAIYKQSFSAKSGSYKIRANNNNRVITLMNGSAAGTRFQPAFEIDNWYGTLNVPKYVYVDGVQMKYPTDFVSSLEPKMSDGVNMGNKLEIQFNRTFVNKDVDIFIDNDDSTGFLGASELMPTLTVSATDNDKITLQNFEGSILGEADDREWYLELDLDGWTNENQTTITPLGFGGFNVWNSSAINPGVNISGAKNLAGVYQHTGTNMFVMKLDNTDATNLMYASGEGYNGPAEISHSWNDSSDVRISVSLAQMTLKDGASTVNMTKTYTIYPTGRIFASYSTENSNLNLADPSIRLSLRYDENYTVVYDDATVQSDAIFGVMGGGDDFHSMAAALMSINSAAAGVKTGSSLYSNATESSSIANGNDNVLIRYYIDNTLTQNADDATEPVVFNFMVDFSRDFTDSLTADSLSRDVRNPGSMVANGSGSPELLDPLDFDGDGFAEGEGAYVYNASNNIAQFTFNLSNNIPQFYPAFKIENWTSGGQPAVVIVNNQEMIRGYQYNSSVSGTDLILQFNQVWTGNKEIYLSHKPGLAVTMSDSDFVAISAVGVDSLKWTTHSEINNLGFRIKRRVKPGQDGISPADTVYKFLFKKMIPGAPGGRSSSDLHYVWVDKTAVFGVVYEYILVAYDIFDTTQEFGPKEASPLTPLVTKLYGNYPNPFNPTTTIRFDLATQSKLALNIYNIKGQLVRRLITPNKALKPGQYRYTWDARNDNGVDVPTGHYLLYFVTKDGYKKARKMTLMK